MEAFLRSESDIIKTKEVSNESEAGEDDGWVRGREAKGPEGMGEKTGPS